jgi:hypothetical protein
MIQFLEVIINLLQFTGRCVLSVVLYVYWRQWWIGSIGFKWAGSKGKTCQEHYRFLLLLILRMANDKRMLWMRTDMGTCIPCKMNINIITVLLVLQYLWCHKVFSEWVPYVPTDTPNKQCAWVSGTFAVVPYWGWCISAAVCGRQWDMTSPFWTLPATDYDRQWVMMSPYWSYMNISRHAWSAPTVTPSEEMPVTSIP